MSTKLSPPPLNVGEVVKHIGIELMNQLPLHPWNVLKLYFMRELEDLCFLSLCIYFGELLWVVGGVGFRKEEEYFIKTACRLWSQFYEEYISWMEVYQNVKLYLFSSGQITYDLNVFLYFTNCMQEMFSFYNKKEILFQKYLGKILNSFLGKYLWIQFFFGMLYILRNKETKERARNLEFYYLYKGKTLPKYSCQKFALKV